MKYQQVLLFFCYLLAAFYPAAAQKTVEKTTIIQFDKDCTIQYGRFGKDSLTLVLQVKKRAALFPLSYFIKGKVLGEKTVAISVPDSLQEFNDSWIFSEYIATADNSNSYFEAQKYAAFAYQPFVFTFKTTPPNANIYIIPVLDWETLFNRNNIDFEFKNTDLPLLEEYKIQVPSPCAYTIFEQRYIAVFVLNDKIKMAILKPKRNLPLQNIADIRF